MAPNHVQEWMSNLIFFLDEPLPLLENEHFLPIAHEAENLGYSKVVVHGIMLNPDGDEYVSREAVQNEVKIMKMGMVFMTLKKNLKIVKMGNMILGKILQIVIMGNEMSGKIIKMETDNMILKIYIMMDNVILQAVWRMAPLLLMNVNLLLIVKLVITFHGLTLSINIVM